MGGSVKKLAVLGSTGSIGQQTLDVVRSFPDRFQVIGLAAGRNSALLGRQILEFRPELAYLGNGEIISNPSCTTTSLEEMAAHPGVDLVVMAVSGIAGLSPTLAAIRAGKDVALATKEVLVAAGEIVMAEAKKHHARILPIDSEPSAIWQCLRGEETSIARLILTASGGPFRHYTSDELSQVTPEEALEHPTWRMGKKVTIDSATLMNKGFEVIELHWLFDLPFDCIEVVVHPQSIVHSMVEFVDGSIKAQLSLPDMHLPIQYALFYPQRAAWPAQRLDLTQVGLLSFVAPDLERFPCLALAIQAGRRGGTYPAALCGADEAAVELFLNKRIGFADIWRLVEDALERHQSAGSPSVDDILAAANWAGEIVQKRI